MSEFLENMIEFIEDHVWVDAAIRLFVLGLCILSLMFLLKD